MNFHGIDLNLLAAFDALMNERNVTRAAALVGVSQPAMSSALARLRVHFSDRLFVRSAGGLLPTPKARDIAQPIARALRSMELVLVEERTFQPEEEIISFTLGVSDYPAFMLLPALARYIAIQAPGVTLHLHAFTARDSAIDLLDAGTIDAAIGVPSTAIESRILSCPLLMDEFVTLVRHDHPVVAQGMDLNTFLALKHVLVSPEGDRYGLVDQALARSGHSRQLALTLSQMFAVPAIIAGSDFTATLMKRVVLLSSVRDRLVFFPPPVTLTSIQFDLMWHRRNDHSSSQKWLRDVITTLAKGLA